MKAKDSSTDDSGIISLLTEVMRLKAIPRTGWLLRGIRDVESVAAHVFGVAMIAMLLADRAKLRGKQVDIEKVLRMALLHDLSEARTGDLPSTIKKYFEPSSIKTADERIVKEMLMELGWIGDSYLELLRDYEDRTSLESRLVKAADKLDLLIQAREYEKVGAATLQEFWESAEADFEELEVDELIEDLLEDLKKNRQR